MAGGFATRAEESLTKLSIAPRVRDNAKAAERARRFAWRVEAVPSGTCSVVAEHVLLRAGAAQTCGKCVPCRDGLPQLAAMLKCVAAYEADEAELARMRVLAEMLHDTSDCAIGYEAAQALLDGMDSFVAEYASHATAGCCQEGAGQTVPCETLCPAHVDVPAYIALTAAGDYAGAVNMVCKDNPFPTLCVFMCDHPCEARRRLLDASVNIRGIKKYAVDQTPADQVAPPQRGVDTARKVAVIGGGPRGLTCAYLLALIGHRETVFEVRAQLGDMLRYCIPAYRFPRERLVWFGSDVELHHDVCRRADVVARGIEPRKGASGHRHAAARRREAGMPPHRGGSARHRARCACGYPPEAAPRHERGVREQVVNYLI